MIATSAPTPNTPGAPEEPADDAPSEMKLSAALQVHGSALVFAAGQLTEEVTRDGGMSRFLKDDIARSVGRLAEALREYVETTAHV